MEDLRGDCIDGARVIDSDYTEDKNPIENRKRKLTRKLIIKIRVNNRRTIEVSTTAVSVED